MKILINKFRHIGDTLLITPLIDNLWSHYPDCKIDVSANFNCIDVLTNNYKINKIYSFRRVSKKNSLLLGRLVNEFRFYRQYFGKNYDIVINLTEGDRGGFVCRIVKSQIKIGYKNKNFFLKNVFNYLLPSQGKRHTIEANLDPLKILNIPIKRKKVELFYSEEDLQRVSKVIDQHKNFVHIHPVSRWMFKCISKKTMAEIIDFIQLTKKYKVVITSGPEEKEKNEILDILRLCSSYPINLSGDLTLKETAALNRKAKLFIGVDTAIMHISAANNVSVIAFFGPSGANHWGPWDNNLLISNYKKRKGIQTMGIHNVISESRACQPCGKDGCNGSKISDCLMDLDFPTITKKINEVLE